MVFNSMGVDTHTCTHTHTDFPDKSNFKKLGSQPSCTPGLKGILSMEGTLQGKLGVFL